MLSLNRSLICQFTNSKGLSKTTLCLVHFKLIEVLGIILKREIEFEGPTENSNGKLNGGSEKDAASERLQQIYKRLEFIDAYSAEARAASILAVSPS